MGGNCPPQLQDKNMQSLFESTKPRPCSVYRYVDKTNYKTSLRLGDWVLVNGERGHYRVNKILDDGFFYADSVDGEEINTTVYDIYAKASIRPKNPIPQSV